MGPKTHELQDVVINPSVDQDQVWPDVAVTVIFPITRQRMVPALWTQGLVKGQGGYDGYEVNFQARVRSDKWEPVIGSKRTLTS